MFWYFCILYTPGKLPVCPFKTISQPKCVPFWKKSLFTVDIVNFPCNFPVQTLPFASGWGRLRTAGRLRWPGVTAVNTLTATKDHRSIIYLPKRWTCGSYGLARNFDKTSLEFWDRLKKHIWILDFVDEMKCKIWHGIAWDAGNME